MEGAAEVHPSPEGERVTRWASNLREGLAVGVVVGSVAAWADAVTTWSGGFEGNPVAFLLYAWALLVVCTGGCGLAFAGWLELLRVFFDRNRAARGTRARRSLGVLRAAAAAAPLLAFVFWVPSAWVEGHWEELASTARALVVLSFVGMFLGTLCLGLVASWLAGRFASGAAPRRAGLLLALLLGVAGACHVADRVVLVGLYEEFHYGLYGFFLLAIAAAVVLAAALLRQAGRVPVAWLPVRWRRVLPALLLGAASVLLGLFHVAEPDVFGPSASLGFSKLVETGRALSDFDADGISGLLGGSDCAGFDPRSGPGQYDFPGNGSDEDCSGNDALWPSPRPRVEYPVPDLGGYDVILITVDALRADHLGAYGYARNTSPNLDALAQRSVVFERAFAAASTTNGSLPAFLSGLYPSNIVHDYARKPNEKWKRSRFDERAYVYEVGAEHTLLAERFQRRGYHTVGCSPVPLLPLLGLARGFDRYEQANCRGVLDDAKGQSKPLFFWTHLYAPHSPYARHRKFDFGRKTIDRYDSEIAKDDAEIGALLAVLAKRGRSDRTIVVVSADHGEEFREHGGEFHGARLYRELIHVPLVVHIPGVSPARITTPVETLGLAPALCELLRLDEVCRDFDAVSLFQVISRPDAPVPGAFAEVQRRGMGSILRSLYDDRWHLILDLRRDRVELYDVTVDPGEQHDVSRQHPDVVARLTEEIRGRPQYRAARLFEAYAQSADPLLLAQNLTLLQEDPLIEHAIDELGRRAHPATRGPLQGLADRPGLREDLRARALAAAERLPAGP